MSLNSFHRWTLTKIFVSKCSLIFFSIYLFNIRFKYFLHWISLLLIRQEPNVWWYWAESLVRMYRKLSNLIKLQMKFMVYRINRGKLEKKIINKWTGNKLQPSKRLNNINKLSSMWQLALINNDETMWFNYFVSFRLLQ